MTSEQAQWLVWLVVAAMAGFALYKSVQKGEGITPTTILETVKEQLPTAKEVGEVVQLAVNATEQLRREKKILTNDAAFNHALDLVKKWIPDQYEVDNQTIIALINAAVLQASALSKTAGKSSENGTT